MYSPLIITPPAGHSPSTAVDWWDVRFIPICIGWEPMSLLTHSHCKFICRVSAMLCLLKKQKPRVMVSNVPTKAQPIFDWLQYTCILIRIQYNLNSRISFDHAMHVCCLLLLDYSPSGFFQLPPPVNPNPLGMASNAANSQRRDDRGSGAMNARMQDKMCMLIYNYIYTIINTINILPYYVYIMCIYLIYLHWHTL